MAIIVTINYDHCHILGNTLKQILSEKAGILHTNCTLGASKEIDKEGYLASLVDKLGITWWEPQGTIPIITNLTYPSINAYLAVTALDKLFNLKSLLEMKEIIKVLKTHQPMARFEKFTWQTHTIILDVAHNPESVANLMQKLQTQSYNLVNALFCVKDTKDFMEILKISKPYIHKWLLPLNEEFGPIAKVLKPHLNAIFVPLDIKLILQDLPDNSTLVVFGTFPLVANVRTQIINEINFVNKG
jgi:folylpolyglutamate synthase/dihydropteroate synthase